jgi:S1-C subfamily serine protease
MRLMLRAPLVAMAALLALALAPGQVQAQVTVQEILLRVKPAVVMVVAELGADVTFACPGGEVRRKLPEVRETGTGWFINPSGWAVTSAQVIALAHEPPEAQLGEQARRAAPPGCRVTAVQPEPSIFVLLSNGFRLPATVAKYSPPVAAAQMPGQDLALLRLEAADMPALSLGDSGAIKIGDRLHILGFPDVVVTHELLNASARVEASVTSGTVSGFKQDRAGQPIIQTDASAAGGNSGGPAVNDEGRVVGVVAFVTRGQGEEAVLVQGFNFVIPGQTVRSFLAGADVKLDEPSRFNAAWGAALRDFFSGNHRRAEKAFVEANRLLPELPDVKRLTVENAERAKTAPARPLPWSLVAGGLIVLSGAAYGVLLRLRWQRNRFRIGPSEVAQLLEGAPSPPLILDVRDDATYARSPVRLPQARHLGQTELQHGSSDLGVEPERMVVAYCT